MPPFPLLYSAIIAGYATLTYILANRSHLLTKTPVLAVFSEWKLVSKFTTLLSLYRTKYRLSASDCYAVYLTKYFTCTVAKLPRYSPTYSCHGNKPCRRKVPHTPSSRHFAASAIGTLVYKLSIQIFFPVYTTLDVSSIRVIHLSVKRS